MGKLRQNMDKFFSSKKEQPVESHQYKGTISYDRPQHLENNTVMVQEQAPQPPPAKRKLRDVS